MANSARMMIRTHPIIWSYLESRGATSQRWPWLSNPDFGPVHPLGKATELSPHDPRGSFSRARLEWRYGRRAQRHPLLRPRKRLCEEDFEPGMRSLAVLNSVEYAAEPAHGRISRNHEPDAYARAICRRRREEARETDATVQPMPRLPLLVCSRKSPPTRSASLRRRLRRASPVHGLNAPPTPGWENLPATANPSRPSASGRTLARRRGLHGSPRPPSFDRDDSRRRRKPSPRSWKTCQAQPCSWSARHVQP